MIRIYLGSNLFFKSASEELALIGPKLDMEANKAGTLSFTVPPDHPYKDSISLLNSVFHVYQDSNYIWSGYPVEVESDFYNQKIVTCEGCLAWLNDVIIAPATYTGTASNAFQTILSAYNAQASSGRTLTFGSCTLSGNVAVNHEYVSAMEAINLLLEDRGGYLRIRRVNSVLTIDWLYDSPHTSAQTITVGKNLIDLTKKNESDQIITRVIPLGAKTGEVSAGGDDARLNISSVNSGNVYLDSSLASTYGIRSAVVIFDDIDTAAALKTAGQNWLTENAAENMVLEVKAYDISYAESDVENFRLLDLIVVKSAPHGISSQSMLLTKLTMNLDDPSGNVITLGTEKQKTMSQQSATTAVTADRAQYTGGISSSIMEDAIKAATDLITGVDGGYIKYHYDSSGQPTEMLIMNAASESSATKIWRWNVNGLGYSNDGGQTYALAMTANGQIVADFIVAGVLQSVNGNYSLDLATGKAVLKDAEITGGSIRIVTDDGTRDVISLTYSYNSYGYPRTDAIAINPLGINQRASWTDTFGNRVLSSELTPGELILASVTGNTSFITWFWPESIWMTKSVNNTTQNDSAHYDIDQMKIVDSSGDSVKVIPGAVQFFDHATPTAKLIGEYKPDEAKIIGSNGNYVKLLPGNLQYYDSNDTLLTEYPANGLPEPTHTQYSIGPETVNNPSSGWGDGTAVAVPAGTYIIVAHAVNGGNYAYVKGRLGIKVGSSKVIHTETYFNGASSDAEMECVYVAKFTASSTNLKATVWVPENAGSWSLSLTATRL